MSIVPEISAKTLLAPMKNGQWWFGGDYNMNLYRGCCHGCIYCDSRSECYGNDQFDTVMVKKDVLTLLEKELKSGAVVITNTSKFPTWKPIQTVITYPKVSTTPDFETLFIYQKP